jgi:hypothetical protein
MAKKKAEVNKSALVREILKKEPKTPTKEIVSALAAQGHKVSDNLIYMLKSKMKDKKRKAKRQKVMATTTRSGIANPVEMIRDIKKLAERAGGLRTLKEMVDVLAE